MRSVRLAIALGVFMGALIFRLATFSITNDDYLHLSLAQQVLLGDLPVRDFIDPGEFLFYYLSAGVQWLFGRHLLSEVLLDVLMLAAGYAMTYLLALRASKSHVAALAVTVVILLLVPRLYSYPKIILYAVAIGLLWGYADARNDRRLRLRWLALLVLFTAVAFLFRHDHGSYIGGAAGVMIVLAHRQDGVRAVVRRLALYGGATAALLLPFCIFLQLNGGLISYWRNTMETGRAEYQRTVGTFPRFAARLASPRIRIRWAEGTGEAARDALAARFHLAEGEDEGGGTWQYSLDDRSTRNVKAIIDEPAVEDTSGIDRATAVVTARAHEPNADAWFYYLTIALPPLALLVLALQTLQTSRAGGRERALIDYELEKVVTISLLAMVMHVYLLRAASDSAIADVSVPTAVLGAWLLAKAFQRGSGAPVQRGVAVRVLGARLLAVTVLLLTVAAASRTDGGHLLQQVIGGSEALAPISEKLEIMRQSSAPFADEGAQYLHACTSERDRVLVTGYVPQVYYQAGRGFAAGRPYFLGSFAPSRAYETFSLGRLQAERVPIVLATSGEDYAAFRGWAPRIHDYLAAHYREAGEIEAAGARFRILVDTRLQPAGTHGPRALPCF